MKQILLDRLIADRAAKRPVALVTALEGGAQALIYPHGPSLGDAFGATIEPAARQALADDQSGPLETEQGTVFIQVHNPPKRLVVVGAVHITQALAEIAALAGYGVTIIDPRRAFAQSARFPNIAVSTAWPDDALRELKPDRHTAIVTLTHDPKIDDPALEVALRSEAFYIGSLGSTRTHAKRLQRLHDKGFTERETARIHGPVGLDIGALSPAEIAISIIAEITKMRLDTPSAKNQAA
ncbi:MAG: xanthine dehydrogenase [Alphaproteobacteria bacterium]|nr:xanthine dehydrogenase [Alphaproteobacteria bacterium]